MDLITSGMWTALHLAVCRTGCAQFLSENLASGGTRRLASTRTFEQYSLTLAMLDWTFAVQGRRQLLNLDKYERGYCSMRFARHVSLCSVRPKERVCAHYSYLGSGKLSIT